MKTRYKLLISVILVWAQVIAPSLLERTGSGAVLFAQEAFYIYRNDGDFNGFFFDEIKRMGVSKLDLDSIEHDEYVVQEVELADTIYRIPLAAIDSIGFQQPEIKFNPRVKFIGKCGLLPYIEGGSQLSVSFYDLPADLKPHIGDVLIGLPTDEKGENVRYVDGSFSCVVDTIETDRWDNRRTICRGHAPKNFGDVFEQYITVEELGYDKDGNLVRRRVAGMPQRKKGESKDYELFHIQGTIQREWNPDENTSIALAADVDVAYRVRLAYDIGWSRFFIKMTRDLAIDVSPSLSMSVKRGFEASLGNFNFPLRIWFPTECPIFELEPYPDFFVRGEGKLEAKLNFPKTYIGFGEDIIFDSNRLFPIDYNLHWVPQKDSNSGDIIDIGSTNVKLSGYVQTGVKFHVNVGTASWFRKLFHCDLGFDIYAGPKITGEMEFSTDWVNNEGFNLYQQLNKTNLTASWLSVDLEAKTTASVLGSSPTGKTFFSTNFPFFPDTLRLIPRIESMGIETKENCAIYKLKTYHDKNIGAVWMDIVLKGRVDNSDFERTIGHWDYSSSDDDYECVVDFDNSGLKAGSYQIVRRLYWAGHGPFELYEPFKDVFIIPYTIELNTSKLEFDGYNPSGKIKQNVYFETNCPKGKIHLSGGGRYKCELKTIDEAKGSYEAEFTVDNNTDIFSLERKDTVAIILGNNEKVYKIECVQKEADLSKLIFTFTATGRFNNNTAQIYYSGSNATMTRIGCDSLEITHSYQMTKEDDTATYYDERNMRFIITRYYNSDGFENFIISEGKGNMVSKTYTSTNESESTSDFTFGPLSSHNGYVETGGAQFTSINGNFNSAIIIYRRRHYGWNDQWGEYHNEWSGWSTTTSELNPEEENYISISFEVIDPTKTQ